ncbi:MAG: hypothetical protein HQ508_02195 [Candidatus Marinimicrobia bacterium]|nr:hypothetical protein [Candidatus Neomarinimicrobiota bacterium]
MKYALKRAASILLIGAALLLSWSCEKIQQPAGDILALVGDRVITREDFMRRAEYTIRPDFCAGDNYIHRKIVLNSLIAEKLLALESPDSPLLQNPDFTAYIQGRQEQAMRQWLYKNKARDQVVMDPTELKAALRQSIRTYTLHFMNLPDSQALSGWQRAQDDGYDFDEVARSLMDSDTIPNHELNWFERGDEAIHSLVFDQVHQKGDVLDPIALEDGNFLIVKIAGWVDRPVIAGAEYQQHRLDVENRVSQKQADEMYTSYVAGIMAGHALELNKPIFKAYSKRAADIYLRSKEEKEKLLNNAIWNSEEQVYTESLAGGPEIPGDAMLFTLDGEVWSVDRFETALKAHPLVFRKKKMSNSEFPQQLKFAIADFVRDGFLTQKAYEEGYDRVANIRQHTNMWKDHYVSRQVRNEYVRGQMLATRDSLQRSETGVLEMYMDPYIDQLQSKYSDQIQINTDLFETLTLSTVPMLVSNRNVPFTLAVPAFPRLTTDHVLNYGRRIEN